MSKRSPSTAVATLNLNETSTKDWSAAPSPSADRFYVPELDVLRFFAFLAVYGTHAYIYLPRHGLPTHNALSTFFLAGTFGVDLFFALSAYLITQLLLRERVNAATLDVKSFYVRRILRIWPLYFFFLAAVFVLSIVFSKSNYYPIFAVRPIYFLTYSLFVGNFALAALGHPPLIVDPLWSVSVEEQFYLCWPWAVRRLNARSLAQTAGGLLLVGALTRSVLAMWGIVGDAFWYNTFARIDSIAVGILVATLPGGRAKALRIPARIALVLAGAGCWLLVAYYCFTLGTMTAFWEVVSCPLVALGSAALLVAALGAGKSGVPLALNSQLIYLGKISYGLYVYHALAIELARLVCLLIGNRAAWNLAVLQFFFVLFSLTFAVILAATSYRWLEAPFLRLKRRYTHVASRPV